MSTPIVKRSCLHLVVKSSGDALEQCYSHFDQHDSVLFLDDGVMHIAGNCLAANQRLLKACFFLSADLEARGLSAYADKAGVRVIQDSEFPGLLQNHPLCLTWK